MLFSHGLGSSPLSGDHIEVFKLFASHGYVVAAPFHGDPRIVDVRLEDGGDLLVAILNFPKYTAMQAVRALSLASDARLRCSERPSGRTASTRTRSRASARASAPSR